MPTLQEYAVVSTAAYNDAKTKNAIDLFGSGWTQLPGGYSDMSDTPLTSGFSASAYQNGNDIVIAFKGTDFLVGSNDSQTLSDGLSDLALGAGLGSSQLIDTAICTNKLRDRIPT